jgi:Fic family protein
MPTSLGFVKYMAYELLSNLFHKNASPDRFAENQALAQRRLQSEAAFATGIKLENGELFFLPVCEMSTLLELTLRLERSISNVWHGLPRIAKAAYVNDLMGAEIFYSNEIEGVRSTRQEIAKALDDARHQKASGKSDKAHKRFTEFAALYLGLTNQDIDLPETPADIRSIYDRVVAGELEEADKPDGALFRAGPVQIVDGAARILHEGVATESGITNMIDGMLKLMRSQEIPLVYSAILAHYLFEYIHPFYDGNGRTGRYLLALSLSKPLSLPTVLSLSKTIAENKESYYTGFQEVEDRLNHSEATSFLLRMLTLIRIAQDSLYDDLIAKDKQINAVKERLDLMADCSQEHYAILFTLAQNALFSSFDSGVSLDELALYSKPGKATVRKRAHELEERGLVVATLRHPLIFALTPSGRVAIGIDSNMALGQLMS